MMLMMAMSHCDVVVPIRSGPVIIIIPSWDEFFSHRDYRLERNTMRLDSILDDRSRSNHSVSIATIVVILPVPIQRDQSHLYLGNTLSHWEVVPAIAMRPPIDLVHLL